jgi:hypothetical protein
MEPRDDNELLNKLLTAIGKGDAKGAERAELEKLFGPIRLLYEIGRERIASPYAVAQRKPLLQKMLKTIGELIELRQQLGVDGRKEIQFAEFQRKNPRNTVEAVLNECELPETLLPVPSEAIDLLLANEAQNIGFLLDATSRDYRKTPIRVFVIEPFLIMLEMEDLLEGVQPLTNVMTALFDWLGIEKNRPTSAGLRTIVREFRRGLEGKRGSDLRAIKRAALHRFKQTGH